MTFGKSGEIEYTVCDSLREPIADTGPCACTRHRPKERNAMTFWEKVKKNIRIGYQEGVYYIQKRAVFTKKRAKDFVRQGQRGFQIYELHSKVQKEMTELGGRIYTLSSQKTNPMLDKRIRAITGRIEKYEERIARLEGRIIKTRRGTHPKPKKSDLQKISIPAPYL